ncbi:winged helix-turn-helix domain-containing protein [Streptomyces sp. TRM 70361]|uniref:response regulator transcription factor n=1 Tax=Streptomyces sp. TRM 70361 TaxID=3116553 RepID=UPI002E7B2838|nr:winged helix-turn-helix domain-containing protein [Streptomyces sp. TRM 70361]MEE1940376.1 winged helix-turn-helix domain-containing protein [Streptomyces sp. TRM 70361]
MNILIVEDDDGMAEALGDALGAHGFRTHRVGTGEEALTHLPHADLVLLDLGLPDLDGHEVCRRIREVAYVPVIALTGRTGELDRVMALHMGADDFVAKPFSRHELVARIRAVFRRAGGYALHGASPAASPAAASLSGFSHVPAQPPAPTTGAAAPEALPGTAASAPTPASPPLRASCPEDAPRAEQRSAQAALAAGPIQLDPRTRKVYVRGKEIRITRKEFDLLTVLMEDPGTVVQRQEIMSRVWDENWYGSTRTLDVHVGSLRSKLGNTKWIETVRGVGYRLSVPAAAHV